MYNYVWREKCHVYLVVWYKLSRCILHPAPNLSTMLCHGKFQIWKFGPKAHNSFLPLHVLISHEAQTLMLSHLCGTFHILNGLQKIKGHDSERFSKFLQSTKTKCLIEAFKINTGWRMDNLSGSSTNPISWIVVKNKYRSESIMYKETITWIFNHSKLLLPHWLYRECNGHGHLILRGI